MDPLSQILSLLKLNSYGFRGLNAGGNWALAYEGAEGIKCFAVATGGCWLSVDEVPAPVWIAAGDLILLPGHKAFRLYNTPEAPVTDALAFFPKIAAGEEAMLNGGGDCTGVGGFFSFSGGHANPLLGLLPPIVHIRAEAHKAALRGSIERLMAELRMPRPGHALIAEHLAQSLLIEALRMHLEDDAMATKGWLFALNDRHMGAAIAAMHADIARKWTLATLAQVAGMSRSSFALRYKETTGETVMDYLTRWRMMVAADGLANGGLSVTEVALAVGYDSDSAFGRTFKQIMDLSPRQYARCGRKQAS